MTADGSRPGWTPFGALCAIQRRTLETAAEVARTARLADDRLADAASVDVGATPSEVVYTENKLELHRYEPTTTDQHDVPILVVYALINRPSVLDLQRDRSVVRQLLDAGHDVYLVDWNEPSLLDGSLTLDDYVNRYLDNCVDRVRERTDVDAVNVLGYCMGGTMAAIYAALYPGKVNALALLATGLWFDDTGGVLELWGDEAAYDPWAVADAFGNVPAEFLAAGFTLMDPVANAVTKYVRLADRLENEDFVRNFARMERWLGDGVDVPGTVYAEFVESIYQENRLCENRLTVGDDRVDLANVDAPVLLLLGEYDNLVPPAASKPFADVVGTDDVTTIEYPTGHVGLAVSRRSHRDVWPEVAEWFVEQSVRPVFADAIGEGVERVLGVDVETDVTVGDAGEIEIGVADDHGEIARAVVRRDARAVTAFLEEALGVAIGIELDGGGIAVTVTTDGRAETVVVSNAGVAVRTEIEESIDALDVAASYDLGDVDGIGPTYADRLRSAGIGSVGELAVADGAQVAEAAQTSTHMADEWIERARALLDADAPGGREH